MKKVASLLLSFLCLLASHEATAAPNAKDLGVAEGSVHKVCVGGPVTQLVKTLKVGTDGWVFVQALSQREGYVLRTGEKYWINLGQVPCISAPFSE